MPGKITLIPGTHRYRVTWGGRITAKSTSRDKAEKQLRLLESTEPFNVRRAKAKAQRKRAKARRREFVL